VIRTIEVVTVKVALVAPAGTVTLGGTRAEPLLLESKMSAPSGGAGPLRVTVPTDDPRPPTALEGFRVSEETAGRGLGATVRLIVVLFRKLPDTPVMAIVNVPEVAVLLAVSVSVLVGAAGFELNDAVMPLERPDADKLTPPPKPFCGVIVIVLVPLVPCSTLMLLGDAARV